MAVRPGANRWELLHKEPEVLSALAKGRRTVAAPAAVAGYAQAGGAAPGAGCGPGWNQPAR